MFYTIFWFIIWLLLGTPALALGTPAFWALIVAIVVDILVRSPYGPWFRP